MFSRFEMERMNDGGRGLTACANQPSLKLLRLPLDIRCRQWMGKLMKFVAIGSGARLGDMVNGRDRNKGTDGYIAGGKTSA